MILEKNNVARCAHMTKIRFRPEEEQIYEKELKDLFHWVEELAEVDTSAVAQPQQLLPAYLRKDQPITDEDLSNQLVSSFSEQEGHCAKVKKVL